MLKKTSVTGRKKKSTVLLSAKNASHTGRVTKVSSLILRPKKDSPLTIVAIGASAGGLEAFTELLKNLSPDTGMAFIYVQHLSPDHKSILTSLLARATAMKVQEVKNKVLIEPNNLYVIPPDKEISVIDGHIKLSDRPRAPVVNLPIDTLFTSLADKHKEHAIGIILSGSASDGTRGMKAIKHEGGLTFAQDDSAKFSSMPKSAIAADAVDFILSPKEIALELVRLSKHPLARTDVAKGTKEDMIENSNPDLKVILQYLHKATGVDFSAYKMTTIKRRIIRRMLLYKIKTLNGYTKLLDEKENEIDILYQDLLINVTDFFRDTDTHTYLKTTLFPRLLKSKKTGETLRIWVAACATGEEAYSFAMMLLEIQDTMATGTPVQIFATDLSNHAINKARIGVYSKQDLESVSPKRLQRFFTKFEGGYRIGKSVRDMCVFAQHNILRDPPFSRLDFISCCNLFIYFETAAQKKAITTFHYALNDDGYLMLGKSETISSSPQLFIESNKKFKIFSRKKNSRTQSLPALTPRFLSPVSEANTAGPKANSLASLKKKSPVAARGLDNAIDTVLVSEFMPACVVINHEMEILQFRGSTDLYLTHLPGKATFNILKMARPEIAFDLRNTISKAIKTKQSVRKSGIEMKIMATVRIISLEVTPLKIEWDEPLLLILFTEQEQVETYWNINSGTNKSSPAKDNRIKKLEAELAAARADAHVIAQEQEAYNEELQSANEEIVSGNEELQTVNEELETSKEEIESANEELTTTNQELQTRNDLLIESYEYSEAVIATMHEPMIVLDKDLRVKSANKSFYRKFAVKEEETEGVLFYDLGNKSWDIPKLRELLESIIMKQTSFHEFEISHVFPGIGRKTMLLNATRILQKARHEQLILLAFTDTTERTQNNKDEKKGLEDIISERTIELAQSNKSLKEQNIYLGKMNKDLETFTYVSSHDLQEPLRKIKNFAASLVAEEEQHLSATGKDYLQRMQDTVKRMQQLIEDLLAYSRVNNTVHIFEKTDLNVIAAEAIADFKETLKEKKAIIKSEGLCELTVIPFQFRQLLSNLISNSIKFADAKRFSRIHIISRSVPGSTLNNDKLLPGINYCHITYTDNGIGFDPKYKDRIFEVFQRLHEYDEYKGTGIGLAICKRIVENHNGIITATGTLNKGARFDIYIPVLQ